MTNSNKLEWEHVVEFEPDEVDQVLALKKLRIDPSLCGTVSIAKMKDGRYFAIWMEWNPDLGSCEEYFASVPAPTEEWDELRAEFPPKQFLKEISNRDAYKIIASFWLPKEFHAYAGV